MPSSSTTLMLQERDMGGKYTSSEWVKEGRRKELSIGRRKREKPLCKRKSFAHAQRRVGGPCLPMCARKVRSSCECRSQAGVHKAEAGSSAALRLALFAQQALFV